MFCSICCKKNFNTDYYTLHVDLERQLQLRLAFKTDIKKQGACALP